MAARIDWRGDRRARARGRAQQSNQEDEGDGGNQADSGAGWPESAADELVDGKEGGTFRFGITEPTAIDPYNAQESEGILVTQYLFTQLVLVEPDGTPKPGVAESWEANDDCSEWSFHLDTDGTFTNGEPVDSAAFKRAWDRVTLQASASEVAYHLAPVEGYREMQSGEATELSGVDASDTAVLRVRLADPDCEFYLRTIHPALSPVPEVAGPADNREYNEQPIGNGLFKMDGPWQHNEGIRLVRNDDYAYGDGAYLDAVEITITPRGNEDEIQGFENGTFDWARMPTPRLSPAREVYEPQDKWITKNTNGMNYLEPITHNPPLDSVEARKAVSLAIDRDAIIEGVFQGSQTPASSIVPPVFTDFYQQGVCGEACEFDPDRAKQLAEEAGLTAGTELEMQFNADAGHEEWMAAVKQQLERNLGLSINMTSVQFVDLLNNKAQPDATGLYRAAWGADYPTPGNFLGPLLATEAIGAGPDEPALGNNTGRYSNPEFDQLIKEAASTFDEAERMSLYQQAEQIAIGQDLALIPLWNRTQHRLANSDDFVNLRMDFNEFPDLSVISIK